MATFRSNIVKVCVTLDELCFNALFYLLSTIIIFAQNGCFCYRNRGIIPNGISVLENHTFDIASIGNGFE